jgi:hypothetical protein
MTLKMMREPIKNARNTAEFTEVFQDKNLTTSSRHDWCLVTHHPYQLNFLVNLVSMGLSILLYYAPAEVFNDRDQVIQTRFTLWVSIKFYELCVNWVKLCVHKI